MNGWLSGTSNMHQAGHSLQVQLQSVQSQLQRRATIRTPAVVTMTNDRTMEAIPSRHDSSACAMSLTLTTYAARFLVHTDAHAFVLVTISATRGFNDASSS